MGERKDEDGFNILIGLILIVFVALALLWAFSGTSSCPENTFSCDNSPCGCCVADANNNSIASCDMGVCPEGTYFFEGMGCCPSADPISCLKPYNYCKTIIPCGDSFCCGTDSCAIQNDGTSKCVPCSVNSVCDPTDVNSCCDGFACGSDGFCKKTNSCVGLKCTNYNQPCSICDSSENCISCSDNSLCVLNTQLGYGICNSMCDSTHPACPQCPSGCCNSDGSCASCLNNACTVAGQPCALSSTIPCAEICANVDGSLTCQSKGNCPDGYVSCNNPSCPGGCCSVIDGSCASCLGQSCSIEEEGQSCSLCDTSGSCVSCFESICHNSLCVSKNSIVNCLTGYVLYDGKCVKESSSDPIIDDDPETPECPTGYILHNNVCVNPNDSTDPIPNNDNGGDNENEDDEVPDWLLNLKTSCIEECEDCKSLECNPDPNVYDLNGDTYLNVKDIEIFTNYYKTILPSIQVNNDNKKFDFTSDNVIDVLDYDCIKNICVDGTCRIIGVNELGICVTGDYFNQTFTQEQRAAMPNYNDLFSNTVETTYMFDCSWANSRNKPYCNAIGKELSNAILFTRNLSYVDLEKDNLGLYYSGCTYLESSMFSSYLESTGCSNEFDIYHSKEFLYRATAYGMVIFNNCVKNTPNHVESLFSQYEGDCSSFKDDVVKLCIDSYVSEEDCTKCDSCDYYTSSTCPDTNECSKYFSEVVLPDGTKNAAAAAAMCIMCALNPSACSSQFNTMCNLCVDYNSCVNCQNHYKGSPTCTKCDNCEKVGDKISFACNNRNNVLSVDALLTEYKSKMDLCYGKEYISSSNCLVYLECLNQVKDDNLCYSLAVNSYWPINNDVYTKQLYCFFDTGLYENAIAKKYIAWSEHILDSTGNYPSGTVGTFRGFKEDCPLYETTSCAQNCVDNAPSCITNCIISNPGKTSYCTNLCTTSCIQNC